MRIHFICPVRLADASMQEQIDAHANLLRSQGHTVHNPKYSVDQTATGYQICSDHLASMKEADEVHIFWTENSKGSHFDLGMAFALGKKVKIIAMYEPLPDKECYGKVALTMQGYTR